MYRHLQTERLLIRPINLNDKEFILNLLNTEGWLKFIGDRKVKDHQGAENYIQNILAKKNFFYSVFEIKETKQPIGLVTFLHRDNQKFPDIGFAMLPQFEKKGYAFEASKKYLDEIIKEKTTNKIIAILIPQNINSIRLIEKLGLKYEDQFMQDSEVMHLYSMTIEEAVYGD